MGDFQFNFSNQDNVGIHKRKSQTQQARDNLRQQEFKQKRLKEEIEDLEETEKEDTIEKDAFESKQEHKIKENKETEVEIGNIWKVKAFCNGQNMNKLEKHILEEKNSNVFEQNYWVGGKKDNLPCYKRT